MPHRTPPDVAACDFNNTMLVNSQAMTLDPGVYCGGITIKGTAKVTFEPGIYVLRDGGLTARTSRSEGRGRRLLSSGNGVTDRLRLRHTCVADRPTDGPMAGLLIFEDRTVHGQA